MLQYNTIQILLSTPHGGFSEKSINSTGTQKKKKEKKVSLIVDCSQSPIFPCDRRDRARLTVNGGHLDFQSYRV